MKLGMLLMPHANARYFDSIRALSLAELHVMNGIMRATDIEYRNVEGLELLCLDVADDAVGEALRALERHSNAQAVFSVEGNYLKPLPFPGNMVFSGDISSILKYKGKTNERFTALLINLAVYSGQFANRPADQVALLDPMCGKGTTLLEGLRRGHPVGGIELDRLDIRELNRFIKQYLQYHKVKHSEKRDSMTKKGKEAGERTRFSIGQGEGVFSVVRADTRDAASLYPKEHFSAAVVDLPYGIQHRSLTGKTRAQIDALMREALPAWRAILKPGAAIALSFNAHNIRLDSLRDMLETAGYAPLTGGYYDGFRHWVEQAVDRDIAVAIRQ